MNLLLKLVGGVTGNPMLLIWIALGAFGAGLLSGGWVAWKVQGYRLDALQARFDLFVGQTEALGKAAQIKADETKKADQLRKEKADHENLRTVAALHADLKRLRDARASSNYLPAASIGAHRADRITFDRAELESAVRRLDAGISGMVEKCDETRVNLDTAKAWAQSQ